MPYEIVISKRRNVANPNLQYRVTVKRNDGGPVYRVNQFAYELDDARKKARLIAFGIYAVIGQHPRVSESG